MHVWQYASQAARRGEWEQAARDRERFRMRIERLGVILNPMLLRKISDQKCI